jgi:ATP/maltotriose-dependent transcriptional regulator MalT
MVGEADRSVSRTRGRTLSLEEIAIVRAAGEYHALRGDWSDALRCSRDCVQSNQHDSVDHATMDYLNAAIACLELGDEETYLPLREEMAARFKDASDVASLRTLEVGLLRRFDVHAGAELELFVRVLTRRVQEGKDQNDYWDRILLSLHEYRIGNFANSMDFARQSLTRLQEGGRVPDAAVSVLLAMSLSRSGNRSAALSELNRAESVLQTGFDLDYDMWNWRRWVLVRLLLREARGLISQAPPGQPGAAPR